jgi:oxygen-independent coproporphyrinogen-3 oxidase
MSATPLGLYVHLPFCRRRCTYCAFAISTDLRHESEYHRALLGEIRHWKTRGHGEVGTRGTNHESNHDRLRVSASPRPRVEENAKLAADTLYFGGGTPSLSSLANFTELINVIRETFTLTAEVEITIETNPEDVNADSLQTWLDAGVNRVSIGVQSWNDAELYPLGRGHGSAAAREAVAAAVATGARVSVDLIIGLPGQTRESFSRSLDFALQSGAGHLSLYMLDLETGSILEKQVDSKQIVIPEDSLTADLYLDAIRMAHEGGFRHYEISNFARPGHESRHNLKYWNRQPYLGFGLGAHSFSGDQRWSNSRDLSEYIAALKSGEPAVVFRESLGELERTRELIFLGLRQAQGMRYSELLELRGQEATEWVSRGMADGWLRSSDDRVAFTGPGFLLSNEYISQLF